MLPFVLWSKRKGLASTKKIFILFLRPFFFLNENFSAWQCMCIVQRSRARPNWPIFSNLTPKMIYKQPKTVSYNKLHICTKRQRFFNTFWWNCQSFSESIASWYRNNNNFYSWTLTKHETYFNASSFYKPEKKLK